MTLKIQKVTTNVTPAHFELLLEADPSKELLDRYLQEGVLFEAIIEKIPVGVLLLTKTEDPDEIEIKNIAVSDQHQHQGIGSDLLQFAKDYATEQGFSKLKVCTGSTSIGQLYFYQKFGFRMSHIESDFFVVNYDEPIYENGIHLKDLVHLNLTLTSKK